MGREAAGGQRVVEGQRLTQAASDIMLGWIRVTAFGGVSRDFYMRQLWDGKGSAVVEMMNPLAMTVYAELCGRALAKALARSGMRSRSGAISARAPLRSCAGFVRRGIRRPERARYHALREAVASGRVAAETDL